MSVPSEVSFEREYFDRNYPDYVRQNPPRKLDFYRRLIAPAAKGKNRPRLLELGCAFGRFLEAVGPDWDRYGLDVSRYAIAQARERVPEATFAVASGAEIPFDETFDCIAAFDVIEHIPDLEQVAREVAAHLRPGGYWVFVVPVYDGPTGPVIRLLDKDPTHVHKQPREFWLDWVQQRFELVNWQGMYRYLLPGGYYAHWRTRWLRRFTPAIAVVARRPDNRSGP